MQQLNVTYIDLVLQHFPCGSAAENQAVWKGLIEAKNQGLVRAVGVSHYSVAELESIVSLNIGSPAVNQCNLYVGLHDDATITYCKSKNITYEAYGALRDVDLTGAVITKIATSHGVSTAQVALRWVRFVEELPTVQRSAVVLHWLTSSHRVLLVIYPPSSLFRSI